MYDFFVKNEEQLTIAGTIVLCIIFALVLLVPIMWAKKKGSKKLNTKQIVFCGVAMALALVTSYMEVYSFPFGGSVTLFSMLFICFIGYLYGAKVSIPVGIAYGLLQFIIKPYVVHPAQIIFDYPLAFGALGLSGFFSQKKHGLVKGYIVGITGRWIFHCISGYIFYSQWAWEGWGPLTYTLAYNGAYIYTEGLATVIILMLPIVTHAFAQVKKMANEA